MKFRALNFDYQAEAAFRAEKRAVASDKPRDVILLCDATVHKAKISDNKKKRDTTVLPTSNNENQEESRELHVHEAEMQRQRDDLAISGSSDGDNDDSDDAVMASKRLGIAAMNVPHEKKLFSPQADVSFHQDTEIDILKHSVEQLNSCDVSSTHMESSTRDSDSIGVANRTILHRQQLSLAQARRIWSLIRQNSHVPRIAFEPWSESIRSASRPRRLLPLPSLLWSANNRLSNLPRQEDFDHLVLATTFAAVRTKSLSDIPLRSTSLVSGNFSSSFRFRIQQCTRQLEHERSLLANVSASRQSIQEKSMNYAVSSETSPNKLLRFAAQLAMVAIQQRQLQQQQQQQTAQPRPNQFELLLDEHASEENRIEGIFDNTISFETKEDSALSFQKARFLEKCTADIQRNIGGDEEDETNDPSPPKRPRFLDPEVTFPSTKDDVADHPDQEFSMLQTAPTSGYDNQSVHKAGYGETATEGFLPEGFSKGIFPPRASTNTNSNIAPVEESDAASTGVFQFEENHAALVARKRRREEKRLRKQQKKARKERKKAKKRKKHEQSDSGANTSSRQNYDEAKETMMNQFASLYNPNANQLSNAVTPACPRNVDAVLREVKTTFKEAKGKTENFTQITNEAGSSRLPRGTMSSSQPATNPTTTPLNLFAQSFKQQKSHVSSRQSSATQMLPMGRKPMSNPHGNNSRSSGQMYLPQSTAPAAAGMSGHNHPSRQLHGSHRQAVERPSHSHYDARQGSFPNQYSQYPAQTSLVSHPVKQPQHSQLPQQDEPAAFTGQQQQESRHHSGLPARTSATEHLTDEQYGAGQPYAQNEHIDHQLKTFLVSAPPGQVEKPIDDPSLPPVQLLCSEKFLETWGDMIAQLSSGKWANPKLRNDRNDACLQRRKILLQDSDCVDAKNVDIELPNRGAIITYTTSALQEVDQAKEIVVSLARLAGNGVYGDVFVCLCYDVWPTGQILRHIAQLENAVIQQNGVPQTRFVFKPASEESLPSIFADIILSRQRFFTGVHLESTNEFLEDEQTREWAWFLAKLLPIISAHGAIQCIYQVKAISPGQSPIRALCQSDLVRQKVQMNITSVPSRAPEIHPYAMQQLKHLISVPFHLAGA